MAACAHTTHLWERNVLLQDVPHAHQVLADKLGRHHDFQGSLLLLKPQLGWVIHQEQDVCQRNDNSEPLSVQHSSTYHIMA